MAKDKRMHFLAGFSITTLSGLFLLIFLDFSWGHWVGLVLATIVGAFKEYVYDYRWKKGTPEHMDFIVTVLGGILAFALMVF